MVFYEDNGALVAKRQGETLRIEGWGENSLRVRATMQTDFTDDDWALTEAVPASAAVVTIGREEDGNPCAEIVNGRVKATVNFAGAPKDSSASQDSESSPAPAAYPMQAELTPAPAEQEASQRRQSVKSSADAFFLIIHSSFPKKC